MMNVAPRLTSQIGFAANQSSVRFAAQPPKSNALEGKDAQKNAASKRTSNLSRLFRQSWPIGLAGTVGILELPSILPSLQIHPAWGAVTLIGSAVLGAIGYVMQNDAHPPKKHDEKRL